MKSAIKWENVGKSSNIHADIAGRRSKYSDNTKIFLDRLEIRTDMIKNQTFRILDSIHDFRLPKKGECLRIRTQTQINLISIIMKIADVHEKIEELTIATYTLNRESFGILEDLLRADKIGRMNLLISSAYSFRDKDWFAWLKGTGKRFAGFDYHLCFAWSHFKIWLAKCGDDYYQSESSMNFSTNNMAENILIENRRESYDHDYNFINRVMTSGRSKAVEIIC